MKHSFSRIHASGNVLFIIMLGIGLFAALTVAVTQSGKNVGGAEKEKLTLMASEIIDYGSALKIATQKIMISNGCADTDLSYENTTVAGYEHSPVAQDKCKIFSPLGGKLSYKAPDTRWLDTTKSAQATYGHWAVTSANAVSGVGAGFGTTDHTLAYTKDLIAGLPWLRKDLCIVINEKLGITNPNGNPPQESTAFNLESKFIGVFTTGGRALEITGGHTDSKYAACIEGNTGDAGKVAGTYHFYQVLVAR